MLISFKKSFHSIIHTGVELNIWALWPHQMTRNTNYHSQESAWPRAVLRLMVPHLASVRVSVRRTVIPAGADLQFPWLNRTRIHFQAHPVIIGRAQCPDSWMDWGPQTLASGPLQRALPAWQLASLGSEGKREVTSHHFCHTLFIRRLGLTHTQGGEGEGIT